LNWKPLPLRQQMHDYIGWLRSNEVAQNADAPKQSGVS
jgi:hypothetical protein